MVFSSVWFHAILELGRVRNAALGLYCDAMIAPIFILPTCVAKTHQVSGYVEAILAILLGGAYIFVDTTIAIEFVLVLTVAGILYQEEGRKLIGDVPYSSVLPTLALITGTVLLWSSVGGAAMAFTVSALGYAKTMFDLVMSFRR